MKQETKFTPGPWVATYWYNDFQDFLVIFPRREILAKRDGPICKICPEHSETETDVANANLIAAAPELLDALQGMVNVYESEGLGLLPEPEYKAALAAIEKATK
jgi:hypothetical protein